MKIRTIALLTIFLTIAALLPVAGQLKGSTYLGEPKAMGKGFIRSIVTTDETGKPETIGFIFNGDALLGLPSVADAAYKLALPKEVAVPPFDHLEADWNYQGHIPKELYGVPHFDFHFYMITRSERDAMILNPQTKANFSKNPPKEYVPKDYIFAPQSEYANMGGHWIDINTPELHGKPFTETFIYGFYNGHLVFLEPMVSLAFLETKPCIDQPIKQPQAFERSGYYPMKFGILHDPVTDQYIVALKCLRFVR